MMALDDVLEQLARDPAASFDIAEIALQLARDEYPRLDVEAYLAEIAALAHEAKNYVRGSFTARVDGLCRYLFHELGFRGNKKEYYDPRNSYFNQVLDRRKGIPITLSAVMMAIGQRVKMHIVGVGLPGHFIVRCWTRNQEILIDPFHGGRRLSLVDCGHLVEQATGVPFEACSESLHPIPLGLMVQRMLNNLKGIYLKREDWARAIRVLNRLRQLQPHDIQNRRDLGICLARHGQAGKAIDHLHAYLKSVPEAEDAATVRQFLLGATREVSRWN
jgi:regulator of sirC expression with transglutaminase-like and TPR domain